VQLEKQKGCKKIFQKKGASSGKRSQLEACLEYVREEHKLFVSIMLLGDILSFF
jgi:hypothetical protein